MARRRRRSARGLRWGAGTTLAAVLLALAAPGPGRAAVSSLQPESHARPPIFGARKRAWERARGGRDLARIDLKRRLEGWPTRFEVDPAELPADDHAFLERVARDTWRGIASMVDRPHGLPINHLVLEDASLAARASRIGDYASASDIGTYLVSVVAARELGFIDSRAATARIRRALDGIDRLETRRGFLFNYYDTTTLERTSDFVSFVDSSWLTAGLIVVRQSVPELAARASRMIAVRRLATFYDPQARQMIHGFYVDPPRKSPYHYGALYTEARLGSLLAIGSGAAPERLWTSMIRTEPRFVTGTPAEAGAGVGPLGHGPGARWVPPERTAEGYYEWRGYRYVPSWGGSMFEALMPVLVLDELHYAPQSLGANDRIHALVQRLYAREWLGYPVWGQSPCWSPVDGLYHEYGVRPLGIAGYPAGVVAPYAAALALLVTPQEATEDLRTLARLYPVYGDWGFYDAVDPSTGRVAHAYLVLDQAMTLIALANHLANGVIQARFAADPIVQRVLPLLRHEHWPDAGPGLGTSRTAAGEPSAAPSNPAPGSAPSGAVDPHAAPAASSGALGSQPDRRAPIPSGR
jgi:hypothetical protein